MWANFEHCKFILYHAKPGEVMPDEYWDNLKVRRYADKIRFNTF